ncbi:MAG: hypothetical protein K2Y23_08925 [Cyanobacteria bacterium]|nr:hypothetical protein [Cyanobacteriota bacterium]
MTNAEWNHVFEIMAAERARLGVPRTVAAAHQAQRDPTRSWTGALRAANRLPVPIEHVGTEVPKPWSAAIERRRALEAP